MNDIRILLLASNDAERISEVARRTLDLSSGDAMPLGASIDGADIAVGIAVKDADDDPLSFAERQIDRVYQCFRLVATDLESIKATTLNRIKTSGSLVILSYSVPEESPEKEEVVCELERALLSEFDGLLLADFGSRLLDKNSRLVFDTEGRSELADRPCFGGATEYSCTQTDRVR